MQSGRKSRTRAHEDELNQRTSTLLESSGSLGRDNSYAEATFHCAEPARASRADFSQERAGFFPRVSSLSLSLSRKSNAA